MALFERKTKPTAREIMEQAQELANGTNDVDQCLEQARNAEEEDNGNLVLVWAERAQELDPENVDAWKFLAKYRGWDSKMYEFDMDTALDAIRHALDLVPTSTVYDTASEIYNERKRQISSQLESFMIMPSYSSSKKVHQSMMCWLQYLEEIPWLTPDLIKNEITLCSNLCHRSRRGIMPQSRVLFDAYCSFNKRESYGDMFQRVLEYRTDAASERKQAELGSMRDDLKERREAYREKRASGALTAEEEKAWLEQDMDTLKGDLERIVGLSNRSQYQQQFEELERQRSNMKSYKATKRSEINEQQKALKEKLEHIDADIERSTAPFRDYYTELQSRLDELESE